jgi:hypothetical protein
MRKYTIMAVAMLVLGLVFGFLGCGGGEAASPTPTATITSTPQLGIPSDFTTYTDDAGIFSISYPQDWEAPLWALGDVEQSVKDYINSVDLSLPVEEAHVLFLAGQPMEGGLDPNINIVVEPRPVDMWTLDSVVEWEVQGLESFATDFHELSRSKMTVGGKEAATIEYEDTYQGVKDHFLQMFIPTEKNVWTITCTTGPEKYSGLENTFYDILRSFRIYK